MSSLGNLALELAMLLAGLAVATALWGQRTESRDLIRLSRRSIYATAAALTLAVVVLMGLVFANDFVVRMVQTSSSRDLPGYYKLTLLWVDLESSLLFWAWILSLLSALAMRLHHRGLPDLAPHAGAILMMVLGFFLYLLLFQKNPFDEYLVERPLLGNGMRPMLRNPWMLVHPPAQYLGYIATTIPFAFCVSALIRPSRPEVDEDDWLRAMRSWIIGAWLMLGFGLVLGMIWAYELIDWSGWWSWDPIENASLFPWLTATALLHAALASLRRGGLLRGWTVFLVLLTFWLTILGTFLTRSGIVRSVHSFGEDKGLFWAFVIFMGLGVSTFGLMIARLVEGRFSTRRLAGFFSLEFFFVVTTWVLLLATLVVLAGTLYPTLHEAIYDKRVTVGPPFFRRFVGPLGLILLALMAVAPLLSWKPMQPRRFLDQLFWPLVVMAVTIIALPMLWPGTFPFSKEIQLGGRTLRAPGFSLIQLTIGLSALAIAAVLQQFVRLSRIRARTQKESLPRAMGGVFSSNRIRYGAHLAHVGTALMFLGFAGKPLVEHNDRVLGPGDTYRVGGVEMQYHSLVFHRGSQGDAVQSLILVREPGGAMAEALTPGSLRYHENPRSPVNEVSILHGLGRDLHVRLADQRGQQITLKVAVHPLVSWLWIGFGVMTLGALVGMFPGGRRRRRRRTASRAREAPAHGPLGVLSAWGLGALAVAWLAALGVYLAGAVDETNAQAAVAYWLVGTATVFMAGVLLWSFLPVLRPAAVQTGTGLAPLPAPSRARELATHRQRLVVELRQIAEDGALGKLTPEEVIAQSRPLRRELAVVLATEDAEVDRERFARERRSAGDTEQPAASSPQEESDGFEAAATAQERGPAEPAPSETSSEEKPG